MRAARLAAQLRTAYSGHPAYRAQDRLHIESLAGQRPLIVAQVSGDTREFGVIGPAADIPRHPVRQCRHIRLGRYPLWQVFGRRLVRGVLILQLVFAALAFPALAGVGRAGTGSILVLPMPNRGRFAAPPPAPDLTLAAIGRQRLTIATIGRQRPGSLARRLLGPAVAAGRSPAAPKLGDVLFARSIAVRRLTARTVTARTVTARTARKVTNRTVTGRTVTDRTVTGRTVTGPQIVLRVVAIRPVAQLRLAEAIVGANDQAVAEPIAEATDRIIGRIAIRTADRVGTRAILAPTLVRPVANTVPLLLAGAVTGPFANQPARSLLLMRVLLLPVGSLRQYVVGANLGTLRGVRRRCARARWRRYRRRGCRG